MALDALDGLFPLRRLWCPLLVRYRRLTGYILVRLASLRLRDSRCRPAQEGQRVSPVMTVLELSCLGMCVGLFRALLPSWFGGSGRSFLAGPSVLALGWGPATRVLRFRQFEAELESTTYRSCVRGWCAGSSGALCPWSWVPSSVRRVSSTYVRVARHVCRAVSVGCLGERLCDLSFSAPAQGYWERGVNVRRRLVLRRVRSELVP